MFEVYLDQRAVDVEGRRRLTVALTLSAMLLGASGALAWNASRLSISRVRAPRADPIMVQALATVPPPPPVLANVTAFCVGTRGRVTDVRTERSHGDSEVDAVCAQAVRKWRFTPTLVEGRPRKVCTRVTFDIRFAP